MPDQGTRLSQHGLTLGRQAVASIACLAVAAGLAGCQSVAGFSSPSLVRVIDASFAGPAVNIYVEKTLFAANVGEGYVSNYGTVAPSAAAVVSVNTVTPPKTLLLSTSVALKAGAQHSVFLTDDAATPAHYSLTVLEDAHTGATLGHSEFRFLNQAHRTGPLDVYMVPADAKLADAIPLCSALAVGATCGYVNFASKTVTMVIAPAGQTTPKYSSDPLPLTGGEVRTVVVVDSQLTSDPPVSVVLAKDVN